jgi:hypothetical protein
MRQITTHYQFSEDEGHGTVNAKKKKGKEKVVRVSASVFRKTKYKQLQYTPFASLCRTNWCHESFTKPEN